MAFDYRRSGARPASAPGHRALPRGGVGARHYGVAARPTSVSIRRAFTAPAPSTAGTKARSTSSSSTRRSPTSSSRATPPARSRRSPRSTTIPGAPGSPRCSRAAYPAGKLVTRDFVGHRVRVQPEVAAGVRARRRRLSARWRRRRWPFVAKLGGTYNDRAIAGTDRRARTRTASRSISIPISSRLLALGAARLEEPPARKRSSTPSRPKASSGAGAGTTSTPCTSSIAPSCSTEAATPRPDVAQSFAPPAISMGHAPVGGRVIRRSLASRPSPAVRPTAGCAKAVARGERGRRDHAARARGRCAARRNHRGVRGRARVSRRARGPVQRSAGTPARVLAGGGLRADDGGVAAHRAAHAAHHHARTRSEDQALRQRGAVWPGSRQMDRLRLHSNISRRRFRTSASRDCKSVTRARAPRPVFVARRRAIDSAPCGSPRR